MKRVKSDGSILPESNTSISGCSGCHNEQLNAVLPDVNNGLQFPKLESDSVHENEISSTYESEVSNLRYTPIMSHVHHIPSTELDYPNDSGDSNFLDLEWLSTSGNSSDERSIAISTPDANLSTENVISDINCEIMENQVGEIQAQKLPEYFVQWVNHGHTFWY